MAAPSVDDLARSFERYLRAGNKSPRTIETYLEAVRGFANHLAATSGRPLDRARREDVEAWIGVLLERWKPATAHNRYRGLHAFYRWLEEEDDLPSPMAKMKPPAVPDQPVPVLTEPQLHALFAVCAGRDFEARRDTALLMVLLDAGNGPCRSAARPPWRWTATFVSGYATGSPTWTRCGSANVGRSPSPGCGICLTAVPGRPASQTCTPTCSATPSPTNGSAPAGPRLT
jgi:hypothetical protein